MSTWNRRWRVSDCHVGETGKNQSEPGWVRGGGQPTCDLQYQIMMEKNTYVVQLATAWLRIFFFCWAKTIKRGVISFPTNSASTLRAETLCTAASDNSDCWRLGGDGSGDCGCGGGWGGCIEANNGWQDTLEVKQNEPFLLCPISEEGKMDRLLPFLYITPTVCLCCSLWTNFQNGPSFQIIDTRRLSSVAPAVALTTRQLRGESGARPIVPSPCLSVTLNDNSWKSLSSRGTHHASQI